MPGSDVHLRRAGAQARRHDESKFLVIDEKAPNVLLERGSLTCRNEQAERLHESTNLVGKFGGDPDQPGACRHERAGQHADKSFHPHLTEEPSLCKMRQTVGVVRVGLIRRDIERSLGMASIDADRWQPFRT